MSQNQDNQNCWRGSQPLESGNLGIQNWVLAGQDIQNWVLAGQDIQNWVLAGLDIQHSSTGLKRILH